MSYTIELLEKFKTKNQLNSDYAAAKALGLTQQAISNYRLRLSHADDRVAVILADDLGIDRFKTIAKINSERAKKPEERAFWKRIATAAAVAALPFSALSTVVHKGLCWVSIM